MCALATGRSQRAADPRSTGGYAFEFGDAPAVERILERVIQHSGWAWRHEVCVPFQKDSLDMTDADRAALVQLLRDSPHSRCIVTHGTDTMIATARAMDAAARELAKVVVVTGAMRPERFANSDAHFNFGCAVGGLGLLGPGAYVCMGGGILPCRQATRTAQGEFVRCDSEQQGGQ